MESQVRGVPKHQKNHATKSVDTIVEITNIATGDGKAPRRLRSSSHHELFKDFLGPDENQDNRLKTPSPKLGVKSVEPPKIDRKSRGELRSRRYSDDSLSLNMPEKEVDNILENSRQNISHLFQEFRKYMPENSCPPQSTAVTNKVLGSPFREGPLSLPSESPRGSDKIHLPVNTVEYESDYRSDTSSENSDIFQPSNRYQALVDTAEQRSEVGQVSDRRIS